MNLGSWDVCNLVPLDVVHQTDLDLSVLAEVGLLQMMRLVRDVRRLRTAVPAVAQREPPQRRMAGVAGG